MTKLQVGIAAALAAAGATGVAVQAQSNARLRDEAAALQAEERELAGAQAENNRLKHAAAEVADMRGDDAEFKRLNDEATALQPRVQRIARADQVRAAAASNADTYDISKLDQVPRVTSQPRPDYAADLRKLGVAGTVVVDFIVANDGTVRNAHAIKLDVTGIEPKPGATAPVVKLDDFHVMGAGDGSGKSGDAEAAAGRLAAAAVAAVSQWVFKPGRVHGQPVNTHMQVPIVFSVRSEKSAASKG